VTQTKMHVTPAKRQSCGGGAMRRWRMASRGVELNRKRWNGVNG
jgi:hypothetical protein